MKTKIIFTVNEKLIDEIKKRYKLRNKSEVKGVIKAMLLSYEEHDITKVCDKFEVIIDE